MPARDFSFLQNPSAYHVLPSTNVPPPFLQAAGLPSLTSPIDLLLSAGHYRLAAIAAARNIVQAPSPAECGAILHLLHIRLACLCLISEHALAAHESKVLGDLNSAFWRHPLTNAHLVPWDLRLLCVRLAALGYGEWRKGIMGYYELAQECRESIAKADSEEDKKLWRARLRECGIRVANVLVEMGELEGAGLHLASLSSPAGTTKDTDIVGLEESRHILFMETLVWLRVGDLGAARRSLEAASGSGSPNDELLEGALTALLHLANSEYGDAVSAFESLHEKFPDNALVSQNLAVCYLYTGRIASARAQLTELVETSPPFHSSVFNLSTIYELCTERNRDRKASLAEKLAAREADGVVGYELANADFKL
jgi:tetratricopeptide (TPR) repeat protein